MGSVMGPVIQANGRLTFEDDFRSGGAGTFSWQDPVHSWKADPGEDMTVGKKIFNRQNDFLKK